MPDNKKWCYVCGRRAHKYLIGQYLCSKCNVFVLEIRNKFLDKEILNNIGLNFIIEFVRLSHLLEKKDAHK